MASLTLNEKKKEQPYLLSILAQNTIKKILKMNFKL